MAVEITSVAGAHDVWGTSADDVWIAGEEGALLHWDGVAWQPVPLPTTNLTTDVRGTSQDDVWVLASPSCGGHPGLTTELLHWNGSVWSLATDLDDQWATPCPSAPFGNGHALAVTDTAVTLALGMQTCGGLLLSCPLLA